MGLQASILLNLLSLRFKQPAVVKANKFGQVSVVQVYIPPIVPHRKPSLTKIYGIFDQKPLRY